MFDEKQKEVEEEQDEAGWFGSEEGARIFAQGFGRARAREKERKIPREYHIYRVNERACTYICARARK